MINFQNAIVDTLQSLFDEQGDQFIFEVSYNSMKSNSKLNKFIRQDGTYATDVKRFIPIIVDNISGDFAEIQEQEAGEFFVTTSILLPSDVLDSENKEIEERFENLVKILNRISFKTRSNVLYLGGETFTSGIGWEVTKSVSTVNLKRLTLSVVFNDNKPMSFYTDGDIELSKSATHITYADNQGGGNLVPYVVSKEYIIEIDYENDELFINGDKIIDITDEVVNFFTVKGDLIQFNSVTYETDKVYTLDLGNDGVRNGKQGKITLNFTLPTRVTEQFTLGDGLNYQIYEFNASGIYTDKLVLGQEIKYFIDDVRVYPIFRTASFLGEVDMARYLGGTETNKGVIEQTGIAKEFTLYYQPNYKIVEIFQHITSETPNANKIYNLKVDYGFFKREHDVIISVGGESIVNSVPVGISFSVDIADDELKS